MLWMVDIKSVTGLSVNDLNQVSERQEKVAPISEQHSQEEETNQCLSKEKATANHSFENAAWYIRKDHQVSYILDGLPSSVWIFMVVWGWTINLRKPRYVAIEENI